MKQLFAVIRSRSLSWDDTRTMEEQQDWQSHAAFMNALHAEGFVLLGGPLAGTPNVLLIVLAQDAKEIRSRLSEDPWSRNDLLRIAEVTPWILRLGSL